MLRNRAFSALVALSLGLAPVAALAQSVNVTRSVLQDQPYTLIYPSAMVPSGGAGDPLTINHPDAPLQCDLTIMPVEDTNWTAESALAGLDDAEIAAAWSESLPGFSISSKGMTQYQNATALIYDGNSEDSAFGMPVTLVHTESVVSGRGYALSCYFASEVANEARPIVDFIIANFSTKSDADCCIGVEVVEDDAGQIAP